MIYGGGLVSIIGDVKGLTFENVHQLRVTRSRKKKDCEHTIFGLRLVG